MDLRNSRTILIFILYIFSMFFLPYITQILLIVIFNATDILLLTALTNFISYSFLLLIVFVLFKDDLIKDFKRIPSFFHFTRHVIQGEVLVYIAMILSNTLLIYGFGIQEDSSNQQAIEQVMSSYPFLMIGTSVLFAPIIEEVIFRFTLMSNPRINKTYSLIVSSVLFGLIHVLSAGDYIYIIPYLTMGLAIGFIYLRTKNIWYPIGVHFLQNLLSTIILLLTL